MKPVAYDKPWFRDARRVVYRNLQQLRVNWISTVSLAVVFAISISFYVRLARRAYFHQDDFVFLDLYGQSLHLGELFQFDRFITRNAYWWVMSHLFGTRIGPYFAANLLIIVGTTVVVFLLLRRRIGRAGAIGGAAIYFSSPAVMWGYNWLSNSQHLIPHFIIFTFLLVYYGGSPKRTTSAVLSPVRCAVLVGLLVVGALSNPFALLVISVLVTDLICRRQRRPTTSELTLIVVWLVLSVATFARTETVKADVYTVEPQLSRFLHNGEIYFGSTTALYGWLAICVYGSVVNMRHQRSLEASMYTLSLAMYVPFGFLKYQVYPQYAAMTLVCLLIGLWLSAHRVLSAAGPIQRQPLFVGLAMLSVVWVNGTPLSHSKAADILRNPVGANAYLHIDSLTRLLSTEEPKPGEVLCFTSDVIDTVAGGLPADWWDVGFGTAFKIMVDDRPIYAYVDANDTTVGHRVSGWAPIRCDRRFFFTPNSTLEER